MGLLHRIGQWPTMTLKDLVDDGERQTDDQFDSVELGMNNGRTVAIIVISADRDIDDEVAAFRHMIME
ncbi:hypothetical protein [Oryzomicrobium sp.]|uniref:hypothetical protein n=1 Tax=Oryzomicrobium sp. TaxID=1911578 RepID=UPI002FDF8D1B